MNGSRWFTAICLVVIILLSTVPTPHATGSGVPHSIIGYVRDNGSNPIMGATVFVNNTRSGDSLSDVSDQHGRYSVDIDAYPSGYIPDSDILLISAFYNNITTNTTLMVNHDPAQQMDLVMDLRTYVIRGHVKRPDGSDARYYSVMVRNVDRNETRTITTDINGMYRVDMASYPSGFANNDAVTVTVNQTGFFGEAYSVITPGPGQWLNLTLSDIQIPAITIHEAPASVLLGQAFRIVARVVENDALESVKLFMKKEGQSVFTELSMIRDDGSENDWNGDGMPNLQIYGRNLPAQTNIGDLYYYIRARDVNGNVGNLPLTDPQANAFVIHVIDNVPPTLAHSPISQLEAGQPREIVATADDNIAIGHVQLMFKGVGQAGFSAIPMVPTGEPKEYSASIPAQVELGQASYYIQCNDTSGNTARLPISGEWLVNVSDTLPPVLTHTKINSARLGGSVNFTCAVADALLHTVWLDYSYGALDDNVTMTFDPNTGKWFHRVDILGTLDTMHYTIWANDTSGNLAKVSHAFPVLDADVPVIDHLPPEHMELGVATEIMAYVEDNVAITVVTLAYLPVGGSAYVVLDMENTDDPTKAGFGNYTATIPAQLNMGQVRYVMNATDGTNTISWPSLSPNHAVDVTDTLPPEFSNLSHSGSTASGRPSPVSINVTDFHSVDFVRLYYLNSTSPSWVPVEMALNGSHRYECEIPAHAPGIVRFYIAANDSSNNRGTLPAATPRFNPLIMNFTDDGLPSLFITLPESLQVNRTAEMRLDATDENGLAHVEAYISGVGETAFELLVLTLADDGSYHGTIPAQMSSGNVRMYATASDGTNVNTTETYSIPVINNLPEIRHVPPGNVQVGRTFSLVAEVIDDLHVENVLLSWRHTEGPEIIRSMNRTTGNYYRVDLSFDESVIIQYRITAHDAEGSSAWPASGFHMLSIMDSELPVIAHSPPASFTTGQLPVFTATVTDETAVVSVRIWYMNSTSEMYRSVEMRQVSGTDDFAVMLERQPEGNFTYFIEASDGVNIARWPQVGNYTLLVIGSGGDGAIPALLLATVFLLIAVAAALVLIYYRRKSIK